MTPIEREEIEKEVNKLLNSFEYAGRRVIALPLTTKEIKERMLILLLTQVEKARKEMLCEAVGWAYADYCISLDKGDDPRKQEMSSVLERAFTDLEIRNELNQKGEQNGKSN